MSLHKINPTKTKAWKKLVEQKDILIRDGIIVAMGDLTGAVTKSEVDASGLHILPGVIETDIHLRDLLNSELRASIRGEVT